MKFSNNQKEFIVKIYNSGCHLMEIRRTDREGNVLGQWNVLYLDKDESISQNSGNCIYTIVYFNIHKVYLKRYEQPTKKYCTPSVDGFTSELFQTSNDRNNTNDT